MGQRGARDMQNSEQSAFSAALRRACAEARLWLGATSPNPPVGAVALDEKGEILAVAAHCRAGGDHAEAALLKLCRAQNLMPRVHTLCVTLEPCNHHGRTPPCAEAIIEVGIRRVVVGARDPNPHVQGGGCDRLRQAGVEVIEGVEAELCRQLIHAFAFHAQTGKVFVTVKRAFDTQGSMIPPAGQKVFTSPESLVLAHRLRKKADAIVTGSGTVLADNPLFTVRHVPDHEGKRRILAVLDRRGRISSDAIERAARGGLDVVRYETLAACFVDLERRGVRDVLVEAGPLLSQSVLASSEWAMCVDIYKGAVDQIETRFNPAINFPFGGGGGGGASLLPL